MAETKRSSEQASLLTVGGGEVGSDKEDSVEPEVNEKVSVLTSLFYRIELN